MIKFGSFVDAAAVIAALLRIVGLLVTYDASTVVAWIVAIIVGLATMLLGISVFI